MFLFGVETLEEAKTLAEQDPAVKAGRLRLEWHPWFAAKNVTVAPKAPGRGPLAPVESDRPSAYNRQP